MTVQWPTEPEKVGERAVAPASRILPAVWLLPAFKVLDFASDGSPKSFFGGNVPVAVRVIPAVLLVCWVVAAVLAVRSKSEALSYLLTTVIAWMAAFCSGSDDKFGLVAFGALGLVGVLGLVLEVAHVGTVRSSQ